MKTKLPLLLALVILFTLCVAFAACGTTPTTLTSGTVNAEGSFEDGVTLSANQLEATSADYAAAINKVAEKDYDKSKVAVFDISLVKSGAKVQPNGKVKITMPAPFQADGYVTYHIDGEKTDELATTFADGKITFETTSFSYFVVAGTNGGSVIGPGGLTPNDPTKNFFAYVDPFEQATMTANGTDVPKGGYSATLKEGDTVELIARVKDGYQMFGWYKNSKSSGNDERYDEIHNPATFTYTGTEKMFVYARFGAIEYTITVNLNGGDFKTGESIPATYNIETKTIVLPTPEKGTEEFLGWTDKSGNPVTEIAQGSMGDVTLTANWKTAVTKVNTIKNIAFAVDRVTLKEHEMVFENENLKVGIGDIPFGASSVHAFEVNKSSQTDDFSYALALGGMWNHESIIELVVAEKDRNVTVGRIHSFYSAGQFQINATDWKVMHVEYEGKLESSDAALDSGWFALLPNVEGYTDAEGKWIYQGDALNVYTDAKRVKKVGGSKESPMTLEGYNGYQHGGGYNKMEFENKADSNGVCKYDKYFLDYGIIRSRTEDRKYDIIAIGDVEVYIGNKETGRAEKLLVTSGNEKKRITITSPIVGEEDWYTTLLFIAKPGGKVIVYNGIGPQGAI